MKLIQFVSSWSNHMARYMVKWNIVYGLNRVFLRYNYMQFVSLRSDWTNNCVYINFKEISFCLFWHFRCSFSFRNGVLRASYLPVKIIFDFKTKRIHPEPIKNAKWIRVCGKKDTQCERSCKNTRRRKTKKKNKTNLSLT